MSLMMVVCLSLLVPNVQTCTGMESGTGAAAAVAMASQLELAGLGFHAEIPPNSVFCTSRQVDAAIEVEPARVTAGSDGNTRAREVLAQDPDKGAPK